MQRTPDGFIAQKNCCKMFGILQQFGSQVIRFWTESSKEIVAKSVSVVKNF